MLVVPNGPATFGPEVPEPAPLDYPGWLALRILEMRGDGWFAPGFRPDPIWSRLPPGADRPPPAAHGSRLRRRHLRRVHDRA